jgi:ATP-binding cassette subfamily C protein
MFRSFIRFINSLAPHYKRKMLTIFFLSVIAGGMEVAGIALIFPLIALVNDPSMIETNQHWSWTTDILSIENSEHMVFLIAGIIGAIFILKNLYMIWFFHMQLSTVQKWRTEICAQIMEKYLKAPFAYHLKRNSGEMVNMLNSNVMFVLTNYVFSFINMFSNLAVALILLLFLLFNFPFPTIISGILLFSLIFIQARAIRHITSEISSKINKARSLNLSTLTQGISAIKETKAYMSENHFLKTYRKTNGDISSFDMRMMFIQNLPTYISEIVLVLAVIVMSCLVLAQAYSPIGGMMSLAVMAAVAFRLAPMINRSLNSYSKLRSSTGSSIELLNELESLKNLEQEQFTAETIPLDLKESLFLENVSYEYEPNKLAVDNVNLTIKKGDFVGIIGPSGAGKTTLVDIMLGLLRPTTGTYYADGAPIDSYEKLRGLRSIAGYVSQDPYIYNASLRENIAFGIEPDEIDDDRITSALRMAQLDVFFREKENYIYSQIGDHGKGLSGGQRQRIAIARALYDDPEIIVFDEATSALDVETEYQITKLINRLKTKKTIIAIAHRISTLKECDVLVLMDKGKIIDTGSFEDLKKRQKSFSRILKLSSIQS